MQILVPPLLASDPHFICFGDGTDVGPVLLRFSRLHFMFPPNWNQNQIVRKPTLCLTN